ncbi:hypothetical protein FSHL1_002732 [Fusarium sambucinum]
MKRLGYLKSRTGCLRCKERRVKCDEKRPCSACIRHEVVCSLGGSPTAQTAEPSFAHPSSTKPNPRSRRVRRSANRENSTLGTTSSPSPSYASAEHCSKCTLAPGKGQEGGSCTDHEDPFFFFATPFSNLILDERASWASDIELMHHYTSIAYRTLSNDADIQKVMQHDLPRLAFQQKFLLHQLLAFSGYHLAYLNDENRHAFFSQASQHQNSAIEGLRTNLTNAHDSEHCHALYAASLLLVICSFASFPSYDSIDGSLDPVDNILGVFSLIKGMNMIQLESESRIKTGPLATFFGRWQVGGPNDKELGLRAICAHVEQLSTALAQTRFLGSDAIHDSFGAQQAIASISMSIESSINRPSATSAPSFRASFRCPILIGAAYMASLRQRHPAALVILAFYCTMLHMAETSCWALEGWAKSLMKCICKSLEGTHWETLIEWPKQIVLVDDRDMGLKD